MSIVVSNNSGNVSNTVNSATTIFWEWTPSSVFKRVWKVGTPFFNSTPIKVRIPAYELMPAYTGYTSFLLHINVDCGSAAQWVQVGGGSVHVGSIGTPVTEGGLTFYEKTISYPFVNFHLLSLGTYFATAIYKISAINPATNVREDIISQGMYFQLEVVNTDVEFLDYTWDLMLINYLYYSYNLSGVLPAAKNVFVYHNVPFTVAVSDPLLLYTVTAATNYSKLELSFDSGISGLSIGIHNFTATLNYGTGLSKVVNIQLEIFNDPSAFYVNPTDVTFEVYRNATAPVPIVVNTISPTPWNINTALPEWLGVSQNSGSGTTDVFLQALNYNHLPAGNYNFNLEFTNDTETKTVQVHLILHDFVTYPFVPGKLFFTQDLDYLDFNSDEVDPTFIEIELGIKIFSLNLYEEIPYTRQYKLPLFKGIGDFHIGTIIHQLLEEIENLQDVVPLREGNYTKLQYAPAEVSVSFVQKNYTSDDVIRSGSIDLIKFIKGHKPYVTENQLSLLTVMQQEVSRITPKSVIGIAFTHLGNPLIRVFKNGNLIEETNVLSFASVPEKIIYSYFRFDNNFRFGDTIEIQVLNNLETRIQRFLVLAEGYDSTYFLFENDNGVIEPFEFSGRVRVNNAYTHITNKVFAKLFERNKKVDSSNNQSLIINTGQLLPSDHKIIDTIIKSKKVWCAFNDPSGRYLLVDSTSTKMTPSDTFKEDNSYDVEFNILEDANATVYPQ
ncbi:hypothetical protein G6N05_05480 [Flavobacterium sp. F372]|uniref:Ig-like domain-containing protein n=1 Tax=Flavobacterium bernardetii TaxID=2813823 RepID=A0ABR7J292_9FLAO|nr:hypothetical protein [Flavobacterium bernardetii]MBC5835832.1 hypothetical protein [Flavobacterium bernardetii]NHF69562.1 hypothetical protein [Flavobacterium bernardetii]